MADQGKLTPYKKVCVIDNGVITRMYWEHPTGNNEFSVDDVVTRWDEMHGKGNYNPTDARFLSDHGFAHHNVIRDGFRPTQ